MTNIVPFESTSANLPAYLQASGTANNEIGTGGSGFKVLGFKGKVWAVKHAGESKPIMKDGAPAPYIDVVVVKVYPFDKDRAKVYYAQKYTEGSDAKPACYSNDGIKPSEYAQDPQSKSCAVCPHNQWGARITDDGKKAKVCQDSKRIAVAVPGHLDDPMLIRVPATSVPALLGLGAFAQARRTDYFKLLTRIGFDYTKAHPQLTFSALGYLDQASVDDVLRLRDTSLVDEICGVIENAPPVQDDMPVVSAKDVEEFEQPAPKAEKKAKAEPKVESTKSRAKGQLDDMVADLEAEKKAPLKVGEPKAQEVIEVEDLDDALASSIGDLLGDDD